MGEAVDSAEGDGNEDGNESSCVVGGSGLRLIEFLRECACGLCGLGEPGSEGETTSCDILQHTQLPNPCSNYLRSKQPGQSSRRACVAEVVCNVVS